VLTFHYRYDHQALTTDPTLTITTPEGKQVTVLPFHLGPTHSQPRRKVQATIQHPTPVLPSMPPGMPISMQSQLKKLQPPTLSSVRVPSTGSMRPPALPTMPAILTHASHPVTEAPADPPNPSPSDGNTVSQDAAPQPQPETRPRPQPQPEPIVPMPTPVFSSRAALPEPTADRHWYQPPCHYKQLSHSCNRVLGHRP